METITGNAEQLLRLGRAWREALDQVQRLEEQLRETKRALDAALANMQSARMAFYEATDLFIPGGNPGW